MKSRWFVMPSESWATTTFPLLQTTWLVKVELPPFKHLYSLFPASNQFHSLTISCQGVKLTGLLHCQVCTTSIEDWTAGQTSPPRADLYRVKALSLQRSVGLGTCLITCLALRGGTDSWELISLLGDSSHHRDQLSKGSALLFGLCLEVEHSSPLRADF